MESPDPDPGAAKRKRSPVDDAGAAPRPIPNPPMPSHGMTQINYLMKARCERLRLIDGDSETFADVLGMIDDYEGEFFGSFIMSFSRVMNACISCKGYPTFSTI